MKSYRFVWCKIGYLHNIPQYLYIKNCNFKTINLKCNNYFGREGFYRQKELLARSKGLQQVHIGDERRFDSTLKLLALIKNPKTLKELTIYNFGGQQSFNYHYHEDLGFGYGLGGYQKIIQDSLLIKKFFKSTIHLQSVNIQPTYGASWQPKLELTYFEDMIKYTSLRTFQLHYGISPCLNNEVFGGVLKLISQYPQIQKFEIQFGGGEDGAVINYKGIKAALPMMLDGRMNHLKEFGIDLDGCAGIDSRGYKLLALGIEGLQSVEKCLMALEIRSNSVEDIEETMEALVEVVVKLQNLKDFEIKIKNNVSFRLFSTQMSHFKKIKKLRSLRYLFKGTYEDFKKLECFSIPDQDTLEEMIITIQKAQAWRDFGYPAEEVDLDVIWTNFYQKFQAAKLNIKNSKLAKIGFMIRPLTLYTHAPLCYQFHEKLLENYDALACLRQFDVPLSIDSSLFGFAGLLETLNEKAKFLTRLGFRILADSNSKMDRKDKRIQHAVNIIGDKLTKGQYTHLEHLCIQFEASKSKESVQKALQLMLHYVVELKEGLKILELDDFFDEACIFAIRTKNVSLERIILHNKDLPGHTYFVQNINQTKKIIVAYEQYPEMKFKYGL